MARTRRTEKTVEIHELYVIKRLSGSSPTFCVECSTGDAVMVELDKAAAVAHVPVAMIYRWVETGLIHYKQSRDGSLTVCVKSLTLAGTLKITKGELK